MSQYCEKCDHLTRQGYCKKYNMQNIKDGTKQYKKCFSCIDDSCTKKSDSREGE